jgi:thiamine-phosphate pyrophosphorylase
MTLQYITQDVPGKSHWQLAEEACRAGIDWIQLRVKNASLAEWERIARQTREVANHYGAKLIINDSLEVALAAGADGVHLGKEDMPVLEARKSVPAGYIIGGTANTYADVERLAHEGADYIGLGPYRFTATKEKLSPVLGVEGYQEIIGQCRLAHISTPIIAIGGIVPEDLPGLLAVGVSGVAVASAITFAGDKKSVVLNFTQYLNHASITNCR